LVVAAVAACHPTGGENPDGMEGPAGLVITWSSQPDIPGGDGNLSISRVVFRIDTLRVIGDAGPGDPRTTKSDFLAQWALNIIPDKISFNDAPTGLYSKISLGIDGHLVANSVEIDGKVEYNAAIHPFTIRDLGIIPIALDTDKMLPPGGI